MEFGERFAPQTMETDELFDDDSPPLKFEKGVTTEEIDVFILMEGEYFVSFAKNHMIDDSHRINQIVGAKVVLYKMPTGKNTIVCTSLCNEIKLYSEAVCLLNEYFKNAKLSIAFQSMALAFYKTKTRLGVETLIRALYSEECKERLSVSSLELPNFITGLTAGVYNECDFNKKSGAVFIFYMSKDQYGLDLDKLKKISQILKIYRTPISQSFVTRAMERSNMYL